MLRKTLLLVGLMIFLTSTYAQESTGRGVIRLPNRFGSDTDEFGSFNPLLCDSPACEPLMPLLFPYLVGFDSQTMIIAPGSTANSGLMTRWQISADNLTYTLWLREDARWSDQTPVTAYDVFYSYLALASDDFFSPFGAVIRENIAALIPLSDYQLQLVFNSPDCDLLSDINFPVIPAHIFAPDFDRHTFDAAADPVTQLAEWINLTGDPDFRFMPSHPFGDDPAVTGGRFIVQDVRRNDRIRLLSLDGSIAVEYIDSPDSDYEQLELFERGEIDLLFGLSVNHWDDVLARDSAQLITAPGQSWDYVGFNLTDPAFPRSAFDDDGNPQERVPHPIFADARVRRAIQLGINAQELIDTALQGYGTVMPGNLPLTSWAFDPQLAPIEYDPIAAEALLESAGWRQVDGFRSRVCIDCLNADADTLLSFSLVYNADNLRQQTSATLIQRQLALIGVTVDLLPGNVSDALRGQTYDAVLHTWFQPYPVSPNHSVLFTAARGDRIGSIFNSGSYYNAEVESLLLEAETLPGCDYNRRRELYREAQLIMRDDPPYVWLYAHDEMVAVRGELLNYTYRPHQPWWNLEQWITWR